MKIKSLPFSLQHIAIVLLIIILAIIAFIFDNTLSEYFVYQRHLISQGELWRLFTGHIFHTNGYHLLLNLAALIMLWALHGRFYSIKNYSLLLLTSAFTCSVGLYYFNAALIQYVGLSGVLHGVFVWGALVDIYNKDKTGYLLFLGVWLKIAHEQIYGASADVSQIIEASVAVDAHLWGAIGGLLFSIIMFIIPKYRSTLTNKT